MILEIMVDSATVFVQEDFFSTFLEKREKTWRYICAWIFFFFYHFTIMNLHDGYMWNFLGNLIGLSIVCTIAYNAEMRTRIMMVLLAVSLGGISEVVISIIILIIQGDISGDIRLYAMMAKIVFWICVRILSLLYKGKVESSEVGANGILFAIAFGCNIIWSIIILNIAEKTEDSMMKNGTLILVFVILVFDIIIFRLYTLYQERQNAEREKQEYAYQIRIYDKEIEGRKAVMDEVRRTKHDMKNSMIYLQELLKQNPDEARKFLNKYIDKDIDNRSEISKSGNLPVDALINYKNIIAKQKGIKIYLEQSIPVKLPYESSDICVVLGNLLDNALEAVKKLEDDRTIYINISFVKKRLKIIVKNKYVGELKKNKNGYFMSEKKDIENHGIGLRSVEKTVQSYDGYFEIKAENQTFIVNVIM